jgi:hypothetical protein
MYKNIPWYSIPKKIGHLLEWEYWSFTAIYIWVYPIWLLLSLRARSFFFFSAANPGIQNGGFLNESKKEIHQLVPEPFLPRTCFFPFPEKGDMVLQTIQESGLRFPLIGKPNIGGRGRGIKVLNSASDLMAYVETVTLDFHIQEYVPYSCEAGIFVYRYPDEAHFRISGIVEKEFLQVKGNGQDTLRQLIENHPRASRYQQALFNMHQPFLEDILAEGTSFQLSAYGNHARGSTFWDATERVDAALTERIDAICQQISGFYYGRLDIRFRDWDVLKKGREFFIIEVNGAGAEPTHIYDPRHSIFFAWKEIVRHWIYLLKISRMNHARGHRYLTFREGWDMLQEDKVWSARLSQIPL